MHATRNEAPKLMAQEKMIIASSAHGDIESDRTKKRAKSRKTSVNSLLSEDHIGDGKYVAIMHNSGGSPISKGSLRGRPKICFTTWFPKPSTTNVRSRGKNSHWS